MLLCPVVLNVLNVKTKTHKRKHKHKCIDRFNNTCKYKSEVLKGNKKGFSSVPDQPDSQWIWNTRSISITNITNNMLFESKRSWLVMMTRMTIVCVLGVAPHVPWLELTRVPSKPPLSLLLLSLSWDEDEDELKMKISYGDYENNCADYGPSKPLSPSPSP